MHEIIAGTEGWEGAVDAVAGIRLGFSFSSLWSCIYHRHEINKTNLIVNNVQGSLLLSSLPHRVFHFNPSNFQAICLQGQFTKLFFLENCTIIE